MTLRGVLARGERMTAAELACEPRSLGVVAWFDGYGKGSNPHGHRPMDMPRRLTHSEAADWREGFAEGTRERRCHDVHGFWPCLQPGVTHPPGETDDRYNPVKPLDNVG